MATPGLNEPSHIRIKMGRPSLSPTKFVWIFESWVLKHTIFSVRISPSMVMIIGWAVSDGRGGLNAWTPWSWIVKRCPTWRFNGQAFLRISDRIFYFCEKWASPSGWCEYFTRWRVTFPYFAKSKLAGYLVLSVSVKTAASPSLREKLGNVTYMLPSLPNIIFAIRCGLSEDTVIILNSLHWGTKSDGRVMSLREVLFRLHGHCTCWQGNGPRGFF